MIQLKEVLHYYLGCEVVDNFQGGKIATLTGVRLDWCYVRYKVFDFSRKVSQIQPILRNTNSLTKEEVKNMPKSCINVTGEGIYYSPEGFKWLLDNHYDLFNLIDTGQAIDKKTLNGEHQHPELLEKK